MCLPALLTVVAIFALTSCGRPAAQHQSSPTPVRTAVAPKLVGCGNSNDAQPTPTGIALSPGATIPAIAGVTGSVTQSEALSFAHASLLSTSSVIATGTITCTIQKVTYDALAQMFPGVTPQSGSLWVVVAQGSFVQKDGSKVGAKFPYEVFTISLSQPLTMLTSGLYASPLPSALTSS